MTEKDIELTILNFLSKQKDLFAWKQNTIGVYDAKSGVYRNPNSPYILKGVSDILGIINPGYFFAIEVKKDCSSKKSKGQIAFVNKINKMGGFSCFATSLEQAQSFVRMMRAMIKIRQDGLSGDKKE